MHLVQGPHEDVFITKKIEASVDKRVAAKRRIYISGLALSKNLTNKPGHLSYSNDDLDAQFNSIGTVPMLTDIFTCATFIYICHSFPKVITLRCKERSVAYGSCMSIVKKRNAAYRNTFNAFQ